MAFQQHLVNKFSPLLISVFSPLRHCANFAATTQKAAHSPQSPFLLKTMDEFGEDTAMAQRPMPKWEKAGLRIERNCAENQIFLNIVQEIVDKFGWDNSAHDYDMWKKAFGPNFSMFFALDQNRVPMGCISMALYPQVAHWSMFYVRDPYHGQQLGRALARRALEFAGDRPVFGYAVPEMWHKYEEEYAFHHYLDWRLWSFGAKCADVRPERLDHDSSVELKDWHEASFDKLLLFDRKQTVGIDRSAYLREALRLPQSAAKVAMCRETGDVVGLCQARHLLGDRLGISLFYANSASVASALLRAVLLQFAGPDPSAKFDSFIYKTPSTNTDSVRLFRQLVQNGPVERRLFYPQFSRYSLPFPGHRIFSIGDEHVSLI
ncbi:hypothetical protein niasHT_001320 [Heterodera trifolii]|uniref:N-acetyltransferase domain-containing protein n=1 Tax=Heterodera trifolii TaxID=157864 RepID=A0ABD2LR25_9BILA